MSPEVKYAMETNALVLYDWTDSIYQSIKFRNTKEITTVAEVLNELKICVDLHKL